MPTKEWISERRQKTFWLTVAEDEAFKRACKAERKKQSDVLRETVLLLIGDERDGEAHA